MTASIRLAGAAAPDPDRPWHTQGCWVLRRYVASRFDGAESTLSVFDAGVWSPRRLCSLPGEAIQLAALDDEHVVAFIVQERRLFTSCSLRLAVLQIEEAWVVALDGRQPTRPLERGERDGILARFPRVTDDATVRSPDGRFTVQFGKDHLTVTREGGPARSFEIDGGEQCAHAHWSPDQAWLGGGGLLLTSSWEVLDLASLEVKETVPLGSSLMRVSHGSGPSFVHGSPDGEWVVANAAGELYALPVGAARPAFGDENAALVAAIERELGRTHLTWRDSLPSDPEVRVHLVRPTSARPFWTLFTIGMSARPMNAATGRPRRCELTLCLPPTWFYPDEQRALRDEDRRWPITLLRDLAQLPHERGGSVDVFHTISHESLHARFGPSADLSGAMLVPPVLWPAALTTIALEGDAVTVLGVVPLTKRELRSKLDRGGAAIWEQLHAGGVTELLTPDADRMAPLRRLAPPLDPSARWMACAAGSADPLTGQADPLHGSQVVDLSTARALLAWGGGTIVRELWTAKSDDAAARIELFRSAVLGEPHLELTRCRRAAELEAALAAAGLATDLDRARPTLSLLSPAEVRARSHGAVEHERGLDDPSVFGGWATSPAGEPLERFTRLGHLELAAPILSPWFYRVAATLLGGRERLRSYLLGARSDAAVREALSSLDLEALAELRDQRGALARALLARGTDPAWMVLEALPIAPTILRPPGSGLAERYRDLVAGNLRVAETPKHHIQQRLHAVRALRRAVTALHGAPPPSRLADETHMRSLRDLVRRSVRGTERLVHYSGIAASDADPDLAPRACALPEAMGLELLKPFVFHELEARGFVKTIREARALVDAADPVARVALANILDEHPVLVMPAARGLAPPPVVVCELRVHAGPTARLAPALLAELRLDAGAPIAVHVPVTPEAVAEARDHARGVAPVETRPVEVTAGWLGRARDAYLLETLAEAAVTGEADPVADLPTRLLLGRPVG